jgi:hypothetical protein
VLPAALPIKNFSLSESEPHSQMQLKNEMKPNKRGISFFHLKQPAETQKE